ncbi:MAG: AAA family ATPase [Woeseiaceae bacterium]
MIISSIHIKGFRNFSDALVNFDNSSLIIGANDVGKSNMLHALRLLLDKSLSDLDIEPSELDFHLAPDGASEELQITIHFSQIIEDSVISILKGYISDGGEAYLRYEAKKSELEYKLYLGHDLEGMEVINSRFYLKYMSLRFIHSQRDLHKFIQREKRQLLNIAQKNLTDDQAEEDADLLDEISSDLVGINEKITQLYYVNNATEDVNKELKKLAHHYSDYAVQLDSGAIEVNQFIEKLQLGARSNGQALMLGGDGRNNQILLALWKAKSERENDLSSEVVFYVVEEPEAHLHPHQQRKLAEYLIEDLPGQSIISTHSPQIAANFSPNSIIRIFRDGVASVAASSGCSDCIASSWDDMGYRISVLPSEVFFSNAVFLVEGPSEMLFYRELSKQLDIDLDFLNISLLSVDGVAFGVYIAILESLQIPWVMRTDNDVSKVSKKELWQYAGINRCLKIAGEDLFEHKNEIFDSAYVVESGEWEAVSDLVNEKGIFISKIDLEVDLVEEFVDSVLMSTGKKSAKLAVKYLQNKKAIRMRNLLKDERKNMTKLRDGELAKPLHYIKSIVLSA